MQSNNTTQNKRRELGTLVSFQNRQNNDEKENLKYSGTNFGETTMVSSSDPNSGETTTASSSESHGNMEDPNSIADLTGQTATASSSDPNSGETTVPSPSESHGDMEAPKTIADLAVLMNKIAKDIKNDVKALNKDVKELKDTVTKGFGVTIAGTQLATLRQRDIQIVDDSNELQLAVTGVPGFGKGTFSFMTYDNKGKIEYLAVSNAHCCLDRQMKGTMQFVSIPRHLSVYVVGAYLLKGECQFGSSYQNKRHADIIFLKLSRFPRYVNGEKVPSWNEEIHAESNQKKFQGFNVAGESLKSPIIGQRVVYDEGTWRFVMHSNNEPGQSGTVMIGFSPEQGAKYVLADDKNKKEQKLFEPRVLGVYTGVGKTFDMKLPFRGIICPIPSPDEFQPFDCLQVQNSDPIYLKKQGVEVWKKFNVNEEFVNEFGDQKFSTYKIRSSDGKSILFVIFIEEKSANQKAEETTSTEEAESSSGKDAESKSAKDVESTSTTAVDSRCSCTVM